jgi:uncharacterized membrane protein (DUF485 family)
MNSRRLKTASPSIGAASPKCRSFARWCERNCGLSSPPSYSLSFTISLPVLVGYAPGLMSKRVIGVVNIAYLFALSQFFMAWIIAALYIRAAAKFDKMEHRVIEKAEEELGLQRGGKK